MNIDWLNATAGDWAEAMFRATWQGAIALLLAWGICALLARRAGRVQCWFWRLGYGKFLFCLLWLVPVNLALLPARPVAPVEVRPELVGDPVEEEPGGPVPIVVEEPRVSAAAWVMGLWCVGVIGAAMRVGVMARRTRKLRRGAVRVEDEAILAVAQQAAREMVLRRVPRILASEAIGGPLLVGIFRPAIVLPARLIAGTSVRDFSEDLARFKNLRLIFAHEIAHIQRRDLAWNWLQTLVGVLFFFHPLVWLTRSPWRLAQEIACDERVLRATKTDAGAYAKLLVGLLEHSTNNRRLMGVGVSESGVTLKRRLLAMKDFSPSKTRGMTAAALAAIFVGIGGLVPWRVVAQTAPATPVPEKAAAAPTSAPGAKDSQVFQGSDPNKIPINDTVITQVVPLTNVDAVRLLNDLRPLLSADANVTANAATNSLVMQDTSARIHRYVEIIAALDHPAGNQGGNAPDSGRGPAPDANTVRGPGVRGARGMRGLTDGTIDVSATLSAQTAELVAPVDGTLKSVYTKPGGKAVANLAMFQFDDAAVAAEYEAAQARVKLAQSKYEVIQQQRQMGTLEPAKAEDAKFAVETEAANLHRVEAELAKYTVKAPFDGTLSGNDLTPGVYVEKGKSLGTLVNTSEIRVSFIVPTGRSKDVTIGQKVTFTPESLPDVHCDGEITYVAPMVEQKVGGIYCRGKITSSLDKIKPGMVGTVAIPVGK